MKPVYKMRRADMRKDIKEKERKKPKISLRQIFDNLKIKKKK